jgi:cobalt-zinc-cadmium efflux system membrane fusion protein
MKAGAIGNLLFTAVIAGLTALAAFWIVERPSSRGHDDHAHGDPHADAFERGPHGGRLLKDGPFAVEITVFERGVPPEFRVYAYLDGEPLPPEDVNLRIELARLDGQIDRFAFEPQGGYLRGQGVVAEPHSFDVTVLAAHDGRSHRWRYENYEGRTRIPADMARVAGIGVETAGPATLVETVRLTGRVQTDPNRLAQVRARFPGIVQAVNRGLGDAVREGEVLARVQSNESLQTYPVKAPIDGLIVRRDLQVGEATGTDSLFVIADLSRVWVELDVFDTELTRVKAGQAVSIETLDGRTVSATIDWLSPLAAHASQSVRARVIVPNTDGALRPGQFVTGRVVIAEHEVPLAVRSAALQRFRDFQVVFARFGETYEVRMLEPGRRDAQWVEVLSGLKPGTQYVVRNSYLIKADIEKSGATHDH